MAVEVQTALIAGLSALAGAIVGSFSVISVERRKVKAAARQSEYDRRVEALGRFNAAAIQWADAILLVSAIARDTPEYEREYERGRARADELREARGRLEVFVSGEVLAHVQSGYLPAERELRSAFADREEGPGNVRPAFDKYVKCLQDTVLAFRADIDRLRPSEG